MNNKNTYNVLDIFCGAGGLSLGFQNANFNIFGGIDFEKTALETHKYNFPNGINIHGDIKQISNETIKELFLYKIDVIIGGPPCQGFSAANKWQNDEEKKEKNKLFFEYIRFIEILKPKVFVIENVRQILTKDNGYAKNEIIKICSALGYTVTCDVLNSKDYGVPQNRIRAFFVGVRNDLNITFNFDNLEKKPMMTVREALSDLYKFENSANSSNVLNHEIKYPIEKVQNRIKYVPQGGNWKDVPEDLWDTKRDNRHSSAYRRLNENDVSITIDTGHMNYFHPIFNRVPTVRESARLQSFPDTFIFKGNKTSQYRQVGNAVPPLLAQAIASEIMKILKRKYDV